MGRTRTFDLARGLLLGAFTAAVATAQGSGPPEDPGPRPVPATEKPAEQKPAVEPPVPEEVPSAPSEAAGPADESAEAPPEPSPSLEQRVAAFLDVHAQALADWRASGALPAGDPVAAALPRAEALVAEGWDGGRLWLLGRADRLWRDPGERARRRRALVTALFASPVPVGPDNGPLAAQVEARGLALAEAARDLVGQREEDVERHRAQAEALLALARSRSGTAAGLVALGSLAAAEARGTESSASNSSGDGAPRANGVASGAARARAESLLDLVRTAYRDTQAAAVADRALFALLEHEHGRALEQHWRRAADAEPVVHPTVRYWAPVEALAALGVGPARWWLVVHAGEGLDDPAARRELRIAQLDALVRFHASEPWLAEAVRVAESLSGQLGADVVRNLGERLLATTEDPEVRAWTQHGLALAYSRDLADPSAAGRAETLLLQLRAEQPDHRLSRSVDALLFQLRHLRPDGVPPDVLARDVDGQEVRLVHTRGMVTALLFWGTWSPPSVALAKELVALERTYADAPFTVLGVVTDSDREAYERVRADLGATWVDAWQESPGGPWPLAWGVREFPTLFLLDAEGRIRRRDLSGDALIQAVHKLVREVRPGFEVGAR
ncbi:MAG: redoxin domain-containing protein [Planctomycetaceae bacterium]|nr:redoxin domain-containing protein [Planctomycetaceae bacterium]